jgi:hypothetical protein
LAAVAGFERRLFENGAEAITVIREAGRTVPELAKVVAKGRARGEGQRRRLFASWPADAWRDGVGVDDALDYSAALYNADLFLLLTRERGWSAERVERWWLDTLGQLLLR